MMIKRYTAAFLIPIEVNKTQGESDWEFGSPRRLSKKVVEQLISALRLDFNKLYSGIKKFVRDNIGMSIFLDDDDEVVKFTFRFPGIC